MSSAAKLFEYRLDADDKIVFVDEAWVRFARENDAPALTRERVIGQTLWGYIAGESTHALYQAIFRGVRTQGEAVELPFRCDTPQLFRFMACEISRVDGGQLGIRTRLIREQARPFYPILDRLAARSEETVCMCSVCLRVQVQDGSWLEPDRAIEQLDVFGAPRVPGIEYRVCEACQELCRQQAS